MHIIRTTALALAFLASFAASALGQVINRSGGGGGGGTPGGDCSGTIAALVCTKSNGVTFGTAAFQNTGTSGATLAFLNGVNTWSGLQTYTGGETNSTAGAALTPAKSFTGAPFVGTTTNASPLLYFNTGVTQPTTWLANGTYIGGNAASGCTTTTNWLDFRINGGATQSFAVNCLGTTTIAGGAITLASNGGITITGNYSMGNGNLIVFGSRGILSSKAVGNTQLGNTDVNGAPVIQTITAQSAVTGSNLAGAIKTSVVGSLSTGSGLSGDVCISTGGTGAGATTQNIPVDAFCVKGATQILQIAKTYSVAQVTAITCNAGLTGAYSVVFDATAPTYLGVLVGGGAVTAPVFCDGAAWKSF